MSIGSRSALRKSEANLRAMRLNTAIASKSILRRTYSNQFTFDLLKKDRDKEKEKKYLAKAKIVVSFEKMIVLK